MANLSTLLGTQYGFLPGFSFAAPAAIGNVTANTGAFTTLTSANVATSSNVATFGTAAYVVANGNVGIGTSSPGQKLAVAGIIQSTTGGVRFPDGSTQTTAGASTGKAIAMAMIFGG